MRNCQWSLDLLDALARIRLRGPVREMYGRVIAETLSDRHVAMLHKHPVIITSSTLACI
jgi:hypothetical protein